MEKNPFPSARRRSTVNDHLVKVEGPKGKLELNVHPVITVKLDDGKKELVVTRPDDEKQSKALHGLTRALLANMIEGVTNGYKKRWRSRASATRRSRRARTSSCRSATPTRSRVPIPGERDGAARRHTRFT